MTLQVQGNAEVIMALEALLDRARGGLLSYVAFLALGNDGMCIASGAGAAALEHLAPDGIKRLHGMVTKKVINRKLPERDPTRGADYVTYNVAEAPLSFDFPHWLIDQEMTRIREGAPAPLKVAFWFGRDGKAWIESTQRVGVLENVLRPMLSMIGAVETEDMGGRFKPFYGLRDVTEAALAGESVPVFRSNVVNMDSGYVTITLRETTTWPHRNSNMDAWLRFGAYLKERGERVIYVRDTAKAHEPIEGEVTCPAASIDLHQRVALYQGAKINLFQMNGPSAMALFMDRPWLAFTEPVPDGHPYYPCTPGFWELMGIEQGGQYPWCTEDQRIVWSLDSYEAIVAAWEARPAAIDDGEMCSTAALATAKLNPLAASNRF
jgi:hypothetical protein